MTRKTRLSLIVFLILGSAGYALIISRDPDLGRSIMLGYIGLVLTIFVVDEIWKKP